MIIEVRDLDHGIKMSGQKNDIVGSLESEVSQKIRLKGYCCSSFRQRDDEVIVKQQTVMPINIYEDLKFPGDNFEIFQFDCTSET